MSKKVKKIDILLKCIDWIDMWVCETTCFAIGRQNVSSINISNRNFATDCGKKIEIKN